MWKYTGWCWFPNESVIPTPNHKILVPLGDPILHNEVRWQLGLPFNQEQEDIKSTDVLH